jgi:hypothetical protein
MACVTIAAIVPLSMAAPALAAPASSIPRLSPTPPVALPGSSSRHGTTGAGTSNPRSRARRTRAHVPAAAAPREKAQLPFTGIDAGLELAIAAALLLMGAVLWSASRGRRAP